ncbi:MAG: Fur family transcriptional regulator [Anaerolineales bacterium]
MTCTDTLTHDLRKRGYRLTPQRLAILQILHDADGHLTPVEVYERAAAILPGITEPTVYRTLDFLSQHGLALAAHIGSGKLVYEIARHQHHHAVCQNCGREVEIAHAALESLYTQIETQTGYALTTSHLTFFGLCPECQKNNP